jgi:hypothetical protein
MNRPPVTPKISDLESMTVRAVKVRTSCELPRGASIWVRREGSLALAYQSNQNDGHAVLDPFYRLTWIPYHTDVWAYLPPETTE